MFLDASGWFAVLNARDQHHGRASPFYRELVTQGRTLILTTNLVVAEMHALLARTGAATGLQFLDRLHGDPMYEVVWSTRDLERAATDRWLRPYPKVRCSLTDAVSFEVMQARGVSRAFTFDRHFASAGFHMVPEVP